MIIRQLILKSIMQLLGGIGGSATAKSFEMPGAGFMPTNGSYAFAPAAKGMVLASNGIQPFAMGGIVNRPTLFPFAKGIGLMGEAGPEGILPLRRGKDGKLGVIAGGGGGSTTINVSVDAKGSSVQGDNGQSGALARAIAGAVQNELIKQKRPGGILTS
jgi:lambda family phage tail tape measure protein